MKLGCVPWYFSSRNQSNSNEDVPVRWLDLYPIHLLAFEDHIIIIGGGFCSGGGISITERDANTKASTSSSSWLTW